jgi:hypothetical protein
MNIKHLVAALVATTTLICGFSTKSHAVGLDFDDLNLSDTGLIPESYGNTEQLDVTYSDVSGLGNNSSLFGFLELSTDDYSYLENAAYLGEGFTGEQSLAPEKSYQVTLSSLDLNAYQANGGFQVYVDNRDFSELLSSQNSANINKTNQNGFPIQWGPDAFNVGIDNVRYDVSPVPEPLTILGSLAAIGVGGFLRREYNRKNQLTKKQS